MAEDTTACGKEGVARRVSKDARIASPWLGGYARTLHELGLHVVRHGSGEQGLAGTGRTVEEHSLRGLDTHAQEELGVREGQLNRL